MVHGRQHASVLKSSGGTFVLLLILMLLLLLLQLMLLVGGINCVVVVVVVVVLVVPKRRAVLIHEKGCPGFCRFLAIVGKNGVGIVVAVVVLVTLADKRQQIRLAAQHSQFVGAYFLLLVLLPQRQKGRIGNHLVAAPVTAIVRVDGISDNVDNLLARKILAQDFGQIVHRNVTRVINIETIKGFRQSLLANGAVGFDCSSEEFRVSNESRPVQVYCVKNGPGVFRWQTRFLPCVVEFFVRDATTLVFGRVFLKDLSQNPDFLGRRPVGYDH
mmetsp:Transcript_21196/g.50088  ORF Transcript_21196/g.50088 Transcript_21196/m.50088 type:complete len:272 (-) Transcript_21196:1372-2187(-)